MQPQLHPVDVAQPEHNQYTLCGHLRTSRAGSHCHCAQRYCAGAAPQQRRCCSSVAAAASPAHKAQLTTALMAQGWCHESVDIATAQGAVQQLRATVPHRSSVAAAAASPLQPSVASAQSAMDHRSALMAQAHWCEDSLPLYKVLCSTLGLPEYCHVCCINRGATELQLELELERLQLRDESTASQV